MAKVTVLIGVSDGDMARELEALAKKAGYRVTGCVSPGKDVLSLAGSGHPSLVLLDSHAGGSHGPAEMIRKIQSGMGIPVVLVASSEEDLPVPDASHAPASGCLVRPFGPRLFGQVTGSVLSRRNGNGGKMTCPAPLVRSVAHDINNSLSSALANIQLARRSAVLKKDVGRHLDNAEKSILRARDYSCQLLAPPEEKERAARKASPRPRKSPGTKKSVAAGYRILLMDDEMSILSATSDMLSFLGHKVTVAKNGEESVELYQKAQEAGNRFDVVILDITIPKGIGAEQTLPLLKAIDPGVRAIISSGYATHPLLVNFAASGFVAALIKPYGFKELEEALAQVPA